MALPLIGHAQAAQLRYRDAFRVQNLRLQSAGVGGRMADGCVAEETRALGSKDATEPRAPGKKGTQGDPGHLAAKVNLGQEVARMTAPSDSSDEAPQHYK